MITFIFSCSTKELIYPKISLIEQSHLSRSSKINVSSLVPVALEVAKPFTGIAELKPDDIGGVIESFLPINNNNIVKLHPLLF